MWSLTPLTEKFDQAISDYSTGLELKIDLLPESSRQIAEAHYKLSIVLDLTSSRQSESIVHAEKALSSVEARLAELRNVLSGQVKVEETGAAQTDAKGKGKAAASSSRIEGDDSIRKLSKSQMEAEVKELEGLKEDLALKVGYLLVPYMKAFVDLFVGGRAQAIAKRTKRICAGSGRGGARQGAWCRIVVCHATSGGERPHVGSEEEKEARSGDKQ